MTIVAYRSAAGRAPWLIAADVGVAMTLVISTRWIDYGARIEQGWPTLPVAWAAASVLACAVAGGRWWGLAGGIAVSAADVIERGTVLMTSTFNGIVLLLIAGGVGDCHFIPRTGNGGRASCGQDLTRIWRGGGTGARRGRPPGLA